jgi:outer membrane protein assembly factor BamA
LQHISNIIKTFWDRFQMNIHRFPYAKVYFILMLTLQTFLLIGQKQMSLTIRHVTNQSQTGSDGEIFLKIDSIKVRQQLSEHLMKLLSKGFIHATLDSLHCGKDACFALIYQGERMTMGNLRLTPEQKSIVEDSGLKRSKMVGSDIDSTLLFSFLSSIVSHQINQGYPFAMAKFDSVFIEDGKLNAALKVEKGKFITFDTMICDGKIVLGNTFMKKLLDIENGDSYSHEKIVNARSRLSDLPYVQQRIDPFIRFVNDKASLIVTLDPKPASRFDFLIGVLPQVKDGVRKWNLTGDFTAELNNTFNQGEYSLVQFKRLKPENLELLLKSTIPYIFGLPVGSHVDFRLFKNGNQNLDLYFDGGLQYLFGGFNNIKLYGSYRSSTLLDVDITRIVSSASLPSNLDISYTGVGVGLNIRNLDYRFNPSKGYTFDANIVAGTKKIIPNRQIIDLEGYENSYDTLQLKTLQAEIDFSAAYFLPVKNWAAIKTGATCGIRYNQQQLRPNELMRIGGNTLLRGFDEESIFTDRYAFATLEFRILFDRNSYLSLPFVDAGIARIVMNGVVKNDPVFGMGMGLNFGTPAGIFNLSFAAGKNGKNPIDFGKMKIHFGYVNLF